MQSATVTQFLEKKGVTATLSTPNNPTFIIQVAPLDLASVALKNTSDQPVYAKVCVIVGSMCCSRHCHHHCELSFEYYTELTGVLSAFI